MENGIVCEISLKCPDFFIQVFFVISHNPYSGKAPVVSCSFFRAENVEDPRRKVSGGIEVSCNSTPIIVKQTYYV